MHCKWDCRRNLAVFSVPNWQNYRYNDIKYEPFYLQQQQLKFKIALIFQQTSGNILWDIHTNTIMALNRTSTAEKSNPGSDVTDWKRHLLRLSGNNTGELERKRGDRRTTKVAEVGRTLVAWPGWRPLCAKERTRHPKWVVINVGGTAEFTISSLRVFMCSQGFLFSVEHHLHS